MTSHFVLQTFLEELEKGCIELGVTIAKKKEKISGDLQIVNDTIKKVKNGIITFVVTNPGVTYFLDTEINTSLENKINEILVS